MSTLYDILGVEPDAPPDAVKAAWRRLVSKWHPDRHPEARVLAELRTREINHAYSVLSDPAARRRYDEELAEDAAADADEDASPAASPPPPFRPRPQPTAAAPPPVPPGPVPAAPGSARSLRGVALGLAGLVLALGAGALVHYGRGGSLPLPGLDGSAASPQAVSADAAPAARPSAPGRYDALAARLVSAFAKAGAVMNDDATEGLIQYRAFPRIELFGAHLRHMGRTYRLRLVHRMPLRGQPGTTMHFYESRPALGGDEDAACGDCTLLSVAITRQDPDEGAQIVRSLTLIGPKGLFDPEADERHEPQFVEVGPFRGGLLIRHRRPDGAHGRDTLTVHEFEKGTLVMRYLGAVPVGGRDSVRFDIDQVQRDHYALLVSALGTADALVLRYDGTEYRAAARPLPLQPQ